jgi:hypothetical protein
VMFGAGHGRTRPGHPPGRVPQDSHRRIYTIELREKP